MMINKIDESLSSQPSSNCLQYASYCGKSDSIIACRKKTELRRLKVLSNAGDSLSRRRRFENTGKEGGDDFPHHSPVIGRRREMEDVVRVEPCFFDENSKKFDFYGVYYGHGGSHVAYTCGERLHKLLMVESFTKMDEEVNETNFFGSMASTTVVAVVGDKEIVVANCGDSKAVLSRGGATTSLSVEHKPDRPDELERIELSGGRVIEWNGLHIMGVLATSRSIGDQQLKPFVISKPEVTVSKREDTNEFTILASGGLWDVISNDLACNVVRKYIDTSSYRRRSLKENRKRTTNAAVFLTELAMTRGNSDNISVIVVNLRH